MISRISMSPHLMCTLIDHLRRRRPEEPLGQDRLVALAHTLGVPPVEFAKRVLRYQDPWTYAVLFEDEEVRGELEA